MIRKLLVKALVLISLLWYNSHMTTEAMDDCTASKEACQFYLSR